MAASVSLPRGYKHLLASFDLVLSELETLLPRLEALEEPARTEVFAFLDGLDCVHRVALRRLAEGIVRVRLSGSCAGCSVASGLGALPARTVAIELEPAGSGPCEQLSPQARAAVGEAVALVRGELAHPQRSGKPWLAAQLPSSSGSESVPVPPGSSTPSA